jgi:ppGpp synthetase/RelA/SpoT-type nucleotidyltranferase
MRHIELSQGNARRRRKQNRSAASFATASVMTCFLFSGNSSFLGCAFVPYPAQRGTYGVPKNRPLIRPRPSVNAAPPPSSRYVPFGVKWSAVDRPSASTGEETVHSNRLRQKLQWIETTLVELEHWSTDEVQCLFSTIYSLVEGKLGRDSAESSESLWEGCLDFATTLLDVTTRTSTSQTTTRTNLDHQHDDVATVSSSTVASLRLDGALHSLVTADVLIASAWHFVEFVHKQSHDCIVASETIAAASRSEHKPRTLPPGLCSTSNVEGPILVATAICSKRMIAILPCPLSLPSSQQEVSVLSLLEHPTSPVPAIAPLSQPSYITNIYNNAALSQIVKGAAQMYRVECLARTMEGQSAVMGRSVVSTTEAARWRGIMLTVDEFDWRSLLLRCVACLYHLEDILGGEHLEVSSRPSTFVRSPNVVWAAREGMRVHATLAQQLGLDRLKARIEEAAFQILYPRQYRAVTALYSNTHIPAVQDWSTTKSQEPTMESVSSYLHARFTDTLFEDSALMSQLETLRVSTRVKERFSLWKKLVKKRFKEIRHRNAAAMASDATSSRQWDSSSLALLSSSLSVSSVQDAIALRVILRARKWHVSESAETTRAREQLLCYYVREKLRSQWPSVEPSRVKDYIQFPKSNGYQSLHYTSSIVDEDNVEFPFEVQIRTDEMHHIAEHGVAKHWAYKLGNQSAPHSSETKLFLPGAPPTSNEESSVPRKNPSTTYLDSLALSAPEYSQSTVRAAAAAGNSYLNSLAEIRQLIAENQVYVFVSASNVWAQDVGKLVAVTANSSVDTALRSMLSESGIEQLDLDFTDAKVWRNGKRVHLHDAIANGDFVVVSLE